MCNSLTFAAFRCVSTLLIACVFSAFRSLTNAVAFAERLFVTAKGTYKAAIPLPYTLSKAGAEAEFNKTRKQVIQGGASQHHKERQCFREERHCYRRNKSAFPCILTCRAAVLGV